MALIRHPSGAKFLLLLALISTLILSACGSSGSTGSSGGTSTPTKVPITVGSKLDLDGHILGEMYVLLLRKAGYTVNSKLALGDNATLLAAIKSSAVDLYPEFTGTGLSILGVKSAYNPAQDYQTVKTDYEQQFQITWLNEAPLNDGYALCTSQAKAQQLGITTLSDLATKVSTLKLATQSDGIPFFDALKSTYGFGTSNFKSVTKVAYAIGFQAVKSGSADVTECYTTDGSVATQNFVFITDDKHGFTEFHPAPIVRDSTLHSDPGIAAALNQMAPLMTTDVNVSLQQQVNAKHTAGESIAQAVQEVSTAWLMSEHLL
jgi:osmoprotectant transport system substrate-binding protein